MVTASATCRVCGEKGSIPYYYLSTGDRLERWCSNEEFCKMMTAHWEEKDHWLNHTGGWMPHMEIWDGTSCTVVLAHIRHVSMKLNYLT